jgi:hypothetical protein
LPHQHPSVRREASSVFIRVLGAQPIRFVETVDRSLALLPFSRTTRHCSAIVIGSERETEPRKPLGAPGVADEVSMTKDRSHLVLKAACLCVAFVLPLTAHARTYIATFESGPLTPFTNGGVPGVTQLTMKLDSSAPFQSGVEGVWNGKYNFSDGANSLKSLIAQGFKTEEGSPVVEVVLDKAGKVTGWFFHTTMKNRTVHAVYDLVGEYDIDGSGHVDTCGVSLGTKQFDQSSLGDGLPGKIKP